VDKSLDSKDIENIVRISVQNPTEACREVFLLSHPGYIVDEITHPNRYFEASMDYFEQKEKFTAQLQNPQNPQSRPPEQNVVIY